VMLGIDESARQFVHKDTRAKLGTDGLIGNKIVILYGGTPASPQIAKGDVLAVEKSLGMEDLMTTLQANNKNILDITNDFKQISKGLAGGQGSIGKLLKEETLANDLYATLATLQRATQHAEQLTNRMNAFAGKMQQPGTLPHELVTDTILFSRLRSSVAQIEDATSKANEVMGTIRTASNNLTTDLSKDNTPAGVLLRDEETAAYLKAAIKNLQSSTEKLDQNMEALQHNFLFRGFFNKKKKEEAQK
jgi:phospholipid/cholesterol/gamma-HCH transport system substrate-binding protein